MLVFAVQDRLSGVDLTAAGYIWMIVGLVAAALPWTQTRPATKKKAASIPRTQHTPDGTVPTHESELI